jgi:hypothetical protein
MSQQVKQERSVTPRRKSDRGWEFVQGISMILLIFAFAGGLALGNAIGNKELKDEVRWLIVDRDKWRDLREGCESNNRVWQRSYDDVIRINQDWAKSCVKPSR